jgi:hypothetical protein
MRLIWTMTAAALAVTGLTGCQSEESYRANLRTQALANCRTGANGEAGATAQLQQVGMTVDQFCTCAIDRYMRAASYDQLKREQSNPSPPGLTSAGMQCVAEHVQQSGAGAAAPEAGATPAAPDAAPAAPAEADNAGSAGNEGTAAEK